MSEENLNANQLFQQLNELAIEFLDRLDAPVLTRKQIDLAEMTSCRTIQVPKSF